jgi:hypothetical protein
VYLLDAVLEVTLIVLWAIALMRERRPVRSTHLASHPAPGR